MKPEETSKLKTTMYETTCSFSGCGKTCYTFAKNRRGDLPPVYCNKLCEGQAETQKKFKRF